MNDYSINAVITLDTSEYKKGINEAQKSTKNFSGNFSKLTKGLGGALLKGGAIGLGITAVTKGLQGLSKVVKQSTKEWEDANAAQKKLAQTLEVTGAAAWTTTEELNAMADAYQSATNFSSNEVTKMQTVLLGFKNITEDTFQSASDAILDMAEVMGMDLVSATQTVGKALDDPINGMGSLSRQGFKFSESEKELIKNLVEAGDAAKAQKIILDELNTTYGGAAREGAKASTQLKNNWKSLLQEMGRKISLDIDIEPALKKINKLLDKWKEAIKEMADAQETSNKIAAAREAVESGTATDEQRITYLNDEIDKINTLIREYEEMYEISTTAYDKSYAKQHLMQLGMERGVLAAQRVEVERRIQAEKEAADAAKSEAEKQQAIADREAAIGALKQKYLEQIKAQNELWTRTEKITGNVTSLEEKRDYYQKQLLAIMEEAGGQITENNQYYKDQMEIINGINKAINEQNKSYADISGWEDKLLSQEIERLGVMKELELGSGHNNSLEVETRYNQMILDLKLEQMEREKEAELKKVEGTENAEEARLLIIKYYAEQERLLRVEANKKATKEVNTETKKETKKTWQDIAKTITSEMKKVANTIKKIFGSIKSMFTKLFDFNIDDALDTLLKFEDKVLTFFVETLPQLPAFFESALQSVGVLLENVLQIVTPERVGGIITDIMKTIADYAPQIIGMIADVISNMIDGIINSLPQILETMNVLAEKLAEELPNLIQKLIDLFIAILKEPDKVAQFVVTLIKMIAEVFNTLVKNIGPLLEALLPAIAKIIWEIIKALPDMLKSTAKAMGEGIKGVGKAVGGFFKDLFTGKLFANGTPSAPKGLAIVGEAGPELVNFRGGEQVLNNRNTQKALAGMGNSGNTFNVTFNNTQDTTAYAMMSQLKQYNRELAINGVI